MSPSVLERYPIRSVVAGTLAITVVVGSMLTIFTEQRWFANYLYTFIYTVTCSFFITVLMSTLHSRISQYSRPWYYGSFVLLVVAGALLGALIGSLLVERRFLFRGRTILLLLVVSLVATVLITLYELSRERFEARIMQLKEIELENERLKRHELEARLDSLRSKLNPHFLFNALNATAELVYESAGKAERNILSLSNLYRRILSISSRSLIPIGEEMRLVRDLLELERLRLEDRLSYEINLPPELEDVQIPGLLIEPLVENAIKHNQSALPVKIDIDVRRESRDIIITVKDNGSGFDVEKAAFGFGLFSVQERLKLLFGEEHGLGINSAEGEGTSVSIRIRERENASPLDTNRG